MPEIASIRKLQAWVSGWFCRLVRDRQVIVRTEGRLQAFGIRRRQQVVALVLLLLTFGWSFHASFRLVDYQLTLSAMEEELIGTRRAYRMLVSEVATYGKQLASVIGRLESERGVMRGLAEKNAALTQVLAATRHELATTRNTLNSTQLDRVKQQLAHEHRSRQLQAVSQKNKQLSEHLHAAKEELAATRKALATSRQVRTAAVAAADRLRGQLAEIEERIRDVNEVAERAVSDAAGADAADIAGPGDGDATQRAVGRAVRIHRQIETLRSRLAELQRSRREVVERVSEETSVQMAAMERMVRGVGLDVERLADEVRDRNEPRGGPFVAATGRARAVSESGGELADLDIKLARWNTLRRVVRRLPLAAPLRGFRITSGFGKRRDPFTGRWARHDGIDLAAGYKAPVLATAPGTVVKAGWHGTYGRFVEIRHARGITTRYAHLAKILVKRRQRVKVGDRIGLLGNSGRSRGAHLHYEVRVDGKPKNPLRFIKAGQYVFQK